MQRLIYSIILSSIVLTANAVPLDEATRNPLGCKNTGYQFQLNTLQFLTKLKSDNELIFDNFLADESIKKHPIINGDRQSLYFVLNESTQPIHLYQMHAEDSNRSTYLNHTIYPKQWAVLATSEPKVTYLCTIDQAKTTYGKIVTCGEYLRVCEYTKVRFGLNNRGNFWVVNSNTRGGAVAEVVNYGIIPQ